MLLANVSDKNVASIVEKVSNGNIMRYIKVMGIEDGNVIVYGKKGNKEDKNLYLHLNESLIEAANLWTHNTWYFVAMQKINDRAKELGINKVIDIRADNNFAYSKDVDYTIGLPAVLRINNPDFCSQIIEIILGSLYGIFDFNVEETPAAHVETNKFKLGTFRPDIPEKDQDNMLNAGRPWQLTMDDEVDEAADDEEFNEDDVTEENGRF